MLSFLCRFSHDAFRTERINCVIRSRRSKRASRSSWLTPDGPLNAPQLLLRVPPLPRVLTRAQAQARYTPAAQLRLLPRRRARASMAGAQIHHRRRQCTTRYTRRLIVRRHPSPGVRCLRRRRRGMSVSGHRNASRRPRRALCRSRLRLEMMGGMSDFYMG